MSEAVYNAKTVRAWTFYDWANSVYNLVITATIFPIYYKNVTTLKDDAGNEISNMVTFFGHEIKNTALYDFAIAFAYLVVVSIIPLLSGIADYSGKKKRFLQFFCYLGALSCASMFFFTRDNVGFGLTMAITACIGFAGGLVFYNAYLPEIAPPRLQDKVSARGFAMGYIGSSILLIVNLMMIQKPEWFGILKPDGSPDKGFATRISFLMVGSWWLLFAQIPFFVLPDGKPREKNGNGYLFKGYSELRKVWNELKTQKHLTRFLTAFFIYSAGFQTIMLVATHFGAEEIKMETGQLITTILIIQFLAVAGSYLFSFSSRKKGNLFTLKLATLALMFICLGTFFLVYTPTHFYVVAIFVGLLMGGTQSLSRSTYSKFLPDTEDHTSYFSFYDVTEKLSIVFGMISFGVISQISVSMRKPIVVLIVFFLIGFILLNRVPKTKTVEN